MDTALQRVSLMTCQFYCNYQFPSARVKLKVIQYSVQAVKRGRYEGRELQPFMFAPQTKEIKTANHFPANIRISGDVCSRCNTWPGTACQRQNLIFDQHVSRVLS